jgi:hypothetical protein
MVILWVYWLPFYIEYARDYSRVEAKGKGVVVILFVLANYAAYRLRRLLFKSGRKIQT